MFFFLNLQAVGREIKHFGYTLVESVNSSTDATTPRRTQQLPALVIFSSPFYYHICHQGEKQANGNLFANNTVVVVREGESSILLMLIYHVISLGICRFVLRHDIYKVVGRAR